MTLAYTALASDPFKYLGSCITSGGRCTSHVKSSIVQARGALKKKKISDIQKCGSGNQEEIYKEFHLEHVHIWLSNLDFEECGEALLETF